ncbi:Tip attachment protein J [uncultured Caudovirales phage]|uniref:Tip attachment protein J n=1 Tax=uncultured Caudovirales phage TaxID=2100421 RepID=A0A6J5KMH4_9CAUD|nr:Tip attachment protein J [uncultured Caudovirales phage]
MHIKIIVFLFLSAFALPSFAIGVTIATALGMVLASGALTTAGMALAMAINMVVATIVTKAFANQPSYDSGASGSSPNLGNRQQISPASDNKLPVVYGQAYIGGTVTDLTISDNNQELYYVISICEVTNTNAGQTADTITFGNVYFGGKKVVFQGNGYTVASLLDESTGISDTTVNGKIEFYLYRNGSNAPANSSQTAIQVLSNASLSYQWDAAKLMTNCAFAILHLSYSQSANIRGLENTKFQVTNSRTNTGDCFYDYLINTRYGCSIGSTQIDTTSLASLTTYSNGSFAYTGSDGNPATQPRFKFNGTLDTSRTVMANLQDMATCCDCLIKYNEITAKWGVIVQSPTYTAVMDINDSNMISAIQITPMDIAASYNVIECKFPDSSNQDAFNSATFDLAEIDPALLYPNEPVNKLSLSLPLTNNDVTAQYIANRFLKAGREDLQVEVSVSFIGVQLDAGDIVALTNSNYGWVAKPFRINKVVQQFNDDGSIAVQLNMSEYNATVFDDVSITQFQPAPNTGIGDPTFFGIPDAPAIISQYPTVTNPSFIVQVRTSLAGITQYAEVWYSAFANPLQEQMYFAGTSEIQSNGTPWNVYTLLPNITLTNVPAGNWYFFSRMVNSLASSAYSPPSTLLQWRPSTYQFTDKYLNVAYATDIVGTGFSLNPRGKTYYGLHNTSGTDVSTTPADYTWYLAPSAFNSTGALVYLLFSNRTGRKFSFSTGFAAYAANTGAFVPTSTVVYDPSVWAGLPDGTNNIDLDARTGQLIQTGTTTVGTGEIAISNNSQGNIVASLQQYLDFGGPYTKTSAVATITVDIYGRIVGFAAPDDFNYTQQVFTATSGQTVFTVTRATGYISGQCWVMKNGCKLSPSEYTDTGGATGTVTLTVGATTGDIITITSFKSVNASTGVYASFTLNSATLTNQATYTATGYTLNTGYELLFLNGTLVNAQDYDISGQDITFIGNATGVLEVLQWSSNNLGVANGTPVNIDAFTVISQTIYPFSYNINAFNLFSNGVLFKQTIDYTTATGTYTLADTPTTNTIIMTQQTFARTGAV